MTETNNKALVDKAILIFALRYTLGRKTSAPSIVIEAIQDNIDIFDTWEIEVIIKEIDDCRDYGMECDKIQWLWFRDWLIKRLYKIEKWACTWKK